MSYRQLVLDSEINNCENCPRQAEWRAVGHGPPSAKILVAAPAATYDDEALGQVLHPAGRQYSWLDFLFRHAGYPLKTARKTCAVRCPGDGRASKESVLACRQWLAAEIKATGARALVLVGPGLWGPLLRGDGSELGYIESGARFTLGDDASIPVFFVRSVEDALVIQSPLLPPEDFLRDLKAVAEAVAAARDKAAAIIDPERAFHEFLKIFLGFSRPRSLPPTSQTVHEKIAERLEAIGITREMQGDVLLGISDIFLRDSEGFRTRNFNSRNRSGKPPRFKGRWKTTGGRRANDNLIAMHLTGEVTLASFKPSKQAVLSLDIDNHNDFQRAHFEETITEVGSLFPRGFLVRSSLSGGAHLHLFLDETVPYKELVALTRLFLHHHGLGVVRVGKSKYERVEVPDQGLRLPFGLGSFPLVPRFDEASSVPDMLAELFQHATNNKVSAAGLFQDERREVEERLRKEHRPINVESRTDMAAQLLRDEHDKHETPISEAELKRTLKADPYGFHFLHAPEHIKRLYVRGITCYGTRSKVTPTIAVYFATVGHSEAKAVEVLTYWVNNRPHVSRNIKDHVDEVIEELPEVVSKAYKYARWEGLAAGPFTTGDLRKLLDLLSKPVPAGTTPTRGGRPGRPVMVRNPLTGQVWPRLLPPAPRGPKKQGTSNEHFLELGFTLIRLLRGKGGESYVSHYLMKDISASYMPLPDHRGSRGNSWTCCPITQRLPCTRQSAAAMRPTRVGCSALIAPCYCTWLLILYWILINASKVTARCVRHMSAVLR